MGWVSGRLRCVGGRHERSDKHLKSTGEADKFVSKCRYCGVPMRRRAKRDWVVISKREFNELRQPR
jgi:hypothetical protein